MSPAKSLSSYLTGPAEDELNKGEDTAAKRYGTDLKD